MYGKEYNRDRGPRYPGYTTGTGVPGTQGIQKGQGPQVPRVYNRDRGPRYTGYTTGTGAPGTQGI